MYSKTQIVTAKHVVEQLDSPEVSLGDYIFSDFDYDFPTELPELDLAIINLRSEVNGLEPFKICDSYDLLDEVTIIGYPPVPRSNDAYLVVNKGEVSSRVQLYQPEIQVMIVSSLLRGGNSGGPVLNNRGEVIGIVSENLFNQFSPENGINESIGFAAAIESIWIKDLANHRI